MGLLPLLAVDIRIDSRDPLRFCEHLHRVLLLLSRVPLNLVILELRLLTTLQVGADDIHSETSEVVIISDRSQGTIASFPSEQCDKLGLRETLQYLRWGD